MADSGEGENQSTNSKAVRLNAPEEGQSNGTPKKKQRYQKRGSPYHTYTPEQKALIGKYAAEHGNTKAAEHFTQELGIRIAESTVRLHKKAYYAQLSEGKNPEDVLAIPSGRKGRPRRVSGVLKTKTEGDDDVGMDTGDSSGTVCNFSNFLSACMSKICVYNLWVDVTQVSTCKDLRSNDVPLPQ